MGILKKNKGIVIQTAHEEAADIAAGALGLFSSAAAALEEANGILAADNEYAEATIDALSADIVKNNAALGQNSAVLTKLNDFLAVPA